MNKQEQKVMMELFNEAFQSNDSESIKGMLKLGLNVDMESYLKKYLDSSSTNMAFFEFLLDHIDAIKDKDILFKVIDGEDEEQIKMVLNKIKSDSIFSGYNTKVENMPSLGSYKITPLLKAIFTQNENIVKLIFERTPDKSYDVSFLFKYAVYAYHYSNSDEPNIDIVKMFHSLVPTSNLKKISESIIEICIDNSDAEYRHEIFEFLLENGIVINKKRGYDLSNCSEETIKLFLEHGVNVNAKIDDYPNLLWCLYDSKGFKDGDRDSYLTLELMEMIIDAGANVDAVYNKWSTKSTILYEEISNTWNYEHGIVKLLVKKGANVNYSTDGDSILDLALCEKRPEAYMLLIENGAKHTKEMQKIILHKAVGSPKILEYCIKTGLDVNAKDEYGDTPLHNVDSIESLKILLDAGADPNAQDRYGYTPLHKIPRIYGWGMGGAEKKQKMAEMLHKSGASIFIKNNIGKTPVNCFRANSNGNEKLRAYYNRLDNEMKRSISNQLKKVEADKSTGKTKKSKEDIKKQLQEKIKNALSTM